MMRLLKTINSIPVESLVLWKKFSYIKQLIKNAKEGDLSETNPQLFAAFFCILGTLSISENDVLSTDPITHVSEQIKAYFDSVAKECKAATADDLISITLGLIPLSENNDELRCRVSMFHQIRFLQYGYDSIAGCFITLLAALAVDKIEIKQRPVPPEYNVYIDEIIHKLRDPLEHKDSKESFTKLFESKTYVVEDCVSAFEEIFENISSMENRFDIYKTYLKLLQRTIYDAIKKETEVFKIYFPTDNFEDFSLLVKDYQKPSSAISLLLAKNEKLKKSFSQYSRAISMGEEKALQPTESQSYWKYIFG